MRLTHAWAHLIHDERCSAHEQDLSPHVKWATPTSWALYCSPRVKWATPTNEILSRIRTFSLGPFRSNVPFVTRSRSWALLTWRAATDLVRGRCIARWAYLGWHRCCMLPKLLGVVWQIEQFLRRLFAKENWCFKQPTTQFAPKTSQPTSISMLFTPLCVVICAHILPVCVVILHLCYRVAKMPYVWNLFSAKEPYN